MVGKAERSDDFPGLVGLEQEDEGPDVNPSHALERGPEGLVVRGFATLWATFRSTARRRPAVLPQSLR